ncbi:MAG: OadG family protein [Clostridia bacterium]|nr:OadG family protein [Clostridia bacterium]
MIDSMIWTLAADSGSVALTTTLQGMLMVFAVLALLWAAVEIMRATLTKNRQAGKGTAKREKIPVPEKPRETVAAPKAPQAPAPQQADADGALVAAITAAIAATLAQEGYTGGFRVVSFKRTSANTRRGRY